MQTGRYEQWEESQRGPCERMAKQVCRYLDDGGVFVDIGANVGLVSEYVLKMRNCHIIAFEPVPDLHAICQRRFGNSVNVKVEPFSVSDISGQETLWVDEVNFGWNTLVGEKQTPNMRQVVVNSLTLDDYVQQRAVTRIDVVKIDVEGAEYKVLKGMQNTLARTVRLPVIVCEVGWGAANHPHWQEEVEVFEWLFANGYRRTNYQLDQTGDVVFRPSLIGSVIRKMRRAWRR